MAIYVTCMGAVYRFTDSRYRNFLLMVAAGTEPILDNHATCLGPIAGNFTTITPDEARELFRQITTTPYKGPGRPIGGY